MTQQQSMFNEQIDTSNLSDNEMMKAQAILNQEMVNHLRSLFKTGQAIFVPTNTPSLKNSKEIMQIMTKRTMCCGKKGGIMTGSNKDGWECSNCGLKPAQRVMIPSLQPSQPVKKFQAQQDRKMIENLSVWKTMIEGKKTPYRICFYFIRNSARIFDYGNASHILLDMMTEKKYYHDDDVLRVMPEYLGFHVDKDKPGAIITLYTPEIETLKNKIYGKV